MEASQRRRLQHGGWAVTLDSDSGLLFSVAGSVMGSLLDKHLEEASRKPWPVSEPAYAPLNPVWSSERRLNLFFMGTLLPVWYLVYPLFLMGPRGVYRIFDFAIRSDVWWAALSSSFAVAAVLPILLGSVCMAVCCLWPLKRHGRWVQSGLIVGGLLWGLIFIVLLAATFFLVSIPTAMVAGSILSVTHLVTRVFKSRYRFSIASILTITFWAASVTVLIPFVPQEYWNFNLLLFGSGGVLLMATPGVACFAFWIATTENNDSGHDVNVE